MGIAIITLSSIIPNEERFYYAFSVKTTLIQKENVLIVKYHESSNKLLEENYLKSVQPNAKIKWRSTQIAEITTVPEKSVCRLITKLKLKEEVLSVQPFYTLIDGLEMGVTDEILVRFLDGVTELQKIELQKRFNTKVVKTTKIYQKLIVDKGMDALDVANGYFETGLLEFAYPAFLSFPEEHQNNSK